MPKHKTTTTIASSSSSNSEEPASSLCVGNKRSGDATLRPDTSSKEKFNQQSNELVSLSPEETKAIRTWIADPTRKEPLIVPNVNGTMTSFSKHPNEMIYNPLKDFVVVETKKTALGTPKDFEKPLSTSLNVLSKDGLCLPFYQINLLLSSCSPFVSGVPDEILKGRILQNSDLLQKKIVMTKEFCDKEMERVEAKTKNLVVPPSELFWDLYLTSGHSLRAYEDFVTYNARRMEKFVLANSYVVHLLELMPRLYAQLFEYSMMLGAGSKTIRAIGHRKIGASFDVNVSGQPENMSGPMIMAALKEWAMKEKIRMVDKIVWLFPPLEFIINFRDEAFSIQKFIEVMRRNAPLSQAKIQHRISGTMYDVYFLTCTTQCMENVVFALLDVHEFRSSMCHAVELCGGALLMMMQSIYDYLQECVAAFFTNVEMQRGALVALSTKNPLDLHSFIGQIDVPGVPPRDPEKEMLESKSMAERQRIITESWKEFQPFSETVRKIFPKGVFKDGVDIDQSPEAVGHFEGLAKIDVVKKEEEEDEETNEENNDGEDE